MTEIILFGQSIKAECPLLAHSGQVHGVEGLI